MMEAFGKYLLLEKIASGGMAEVYLAKSIGANGINKFVAIKRILPQYSDNPEFIDMFKEEAKIAVNLNHGNVVSIFDFGVEKGQFFLVMEFVEGQNLRQILNHMKKETKDFGFDQITYVVKEVAAGLDHAHRCLDGSTGRPLNITHRDMSPQNVMISFEGEIKVVDFGIAKAENQLEQTRAGTIKGKFSYMSPEQADGFPVDLRTDIFSLGIVLWELLAKDRLFVGQSEAATLRKVRECQIPSLRKINPSIPPELERICNKALAKDRSLRYQTAAAFHKDLNRFLNLQYPEFSAQEFSKFMKSLYNKMYVENRKKFSEYAKIQFEEDNPSVITNTATLTSTETDAEAGEEVKKLRTEQQGPYGKVVAVTHPPLDTPAILRDTPDIDMNSRKVDLGSLKVAERPSQSPKVVAALRENTRGSSASSSQSRAPRTQTASYTLSPQRSRRSLPVSPGGAAILFVALGLAVLVSTGELGTPTFLSDAVTRVRDLTGAPTGTAELGSARKPNHASQPVQVTVISDPPGATVFLDGQNKGFTPYRGWVEMNKPFKIALVKEGYLPYDHGEVRATKEDGITIRRTLQPEPPMGYISINVINGGSDPVISVNGQRLTEKLPIPRYQVPAGIPVKIRVYNPITQLYAEETVTVGVGQKIPVRLILGRRTK